MAGGARGTRGLGQALSQSHTPAGGANSLQRDSVPRASMPAAVQGNKDVQQELRAADQEAEKANEYRVSLRERWRRRAAAPSAAVDFLAPA